MAIRVSEFSKTLGISNKTMVLFLAETHPEFGISDPSKHHGKSFSWFTKDESKSIEEEAREELNAFFKKHPELAEKPKKTSAGTPKKSAAGTKTAGTTKKSAISKTAKKDVPEEKKSEEKKSEKAPEKSSEKAAGMKAAGTANAPKVNAIPPKIPALGNAPKAAPVPPKVPAIPPKAPAIVPKIPAGTPPPKPQSAGTIPARIPTGTPIPPKIPALGNAPKSAPIPPKVPGISPKIPAGTPQISAPENASGTANSPEKSAENAAPSAPAADLKKISVRAPVVVRDLAATLEVRPFRLISELMSMGIFASLNLDLKDEVACKVAEKFGVALEIHRREKGGGNAQKALEPAAPEVVDEEKDKAPRPPVVCVLGHVDHGKTTLLDFYRKSNVTAGEAGGITQHVAAYSVARGDKQITFLDTPGHAAFSKMRERGAALTDIAVLVVAADDGFMPQTDEALKFAQKNDVQLVVAINKVDAKGANIDRVKQQMQQRGITSEDWGGTVQCEPVSALKGTGMDSLLDAILLQAEIMELKANPKCAAAGTIVEAQMEQGRGPTATVIIQRGTLKAGDALVCGPNFCRVRALLDEYGKPLKQIAPGQPGRVMGWSGIPSAGAVFSAVKNAREAENIAEENKYKLRKALEEEEENAKKAALEKQMKELSDMERLNELLAGTTEKVFKVVTKADVDGTLEALNASLEAIKSSRVKLEIVGGSVGPITQNDVNMASAAGASIVAFDVKPDNGVPALLKRQNVKVIAHEIIYMLLDTVKEAMAELLDPELKENHVGSAEARVIYPFGKNAFVAGSMVLDGSIRRDFNARVLRKGEVLHTGRIDTLKRFKDDVTEVKSGYECGIRVTGFEEYKEGDVIECFEILKIRPPL